MPSRKRAKGKARKASQKESRLLTNENGVCYHGLLKSTSSNCIPFINEFEKVIRSFPSTDPFTIFCHVKETHKKNRIFDLFTNKRDREYGLAFLVSFATCILTDGKELSTEISTAIALLIFEIEKIGWVQEGYIIGPKTRDLIDGNERDVVRFLKKRISCSCLNDMHKQAKKLPKVGMCYGCKKKKERKDLMICNSCRIAQYCCIDCQEQDWSKHKRMCRDALIFGRGKRQC